MGTAWLKFYNYIYLPLGIITAIKSIFNISWKFYSISINARAWPAFIPKYGVVIIEITVILILTLLIFGLHRRKIWAWYMNIVTLLLFIFLWNIDRFTNVPTYFCSVLLSVGLWFVPNYAYFNRRKEMFS